MRKYEGFLHAMRNMLHNAMLVRNMHDLVSVCSTIGCKVVGTIRNNGTLHIAIHDLLPPEIIRNNEVGCEAMSNHTLFGTVHAYLGYWRDREAVPQDRPQARRIAYMKHSHLLRCGGIRIDASQSNQREVLQKIALSLAEKKDWLNYSRVQKAIVAGELLDRERMDSLTKWSIRSSDDPGARGTHTRAEAYDAEGRTDNVRKPWQRQSAKGCKDHIDRKKQHSVRDIQDRAMRKILAY